MTSFKRQRLSEEDETPGTEEYEVFLSFRGPDTRQGFADVLYDCMDRAGIRVFRDNDELAIGDRIDKILLALDNSQICVPIFSKTFAQSKWCLTEVSKMAELSKDVVPIFYGVTPADVDLKTPAYGDFIAEHKNRYDENIVEKWGAALKDVTKLKGREVLNTSYTIFCKTFVEEVLIKLKPRKRYDLDNLVGMDNQVDKTMKLLDIGADDLRYILIHGMGGIGKTTLAKVIFDKVSASFNGSSLMENIRESSKREGLDNLQKKLGDSLDPKPSAASNICRDIRERFRGKKVLIILDDVDAGEQVEELVGKSCFGSGSRIIITTRNADVLNECKDLGADSVRSLEIETLQDKEALELFKLHAFRKDSPPLIDGSLPEEAISTTGGLPLAIEVIASLLRGKKEKDWRDVIESSRKIPPEKVKDRLKISYEALNVYQKQIFLDIACFFIGKEKTNPTYMWGACQLYPNYQLGVLVAMSLVKITDRNVIWMHDQLRDLGRDIVLEESINNPMKRSRIWLPEDAVKVLEGKRGKKRVEALSLRERLKLTLTRGQCAGFRNLRFLELDEDVQLEGDCECLWTELKWFSWYCFPSDFKVSPSFSTNLVILNLSRSWIDETWGAWIPLIQMAVNLKVLDLSDCFNLTRTPNFSRNLSLERLILSHCWRLAEIGSSIGNLRRLKFLDLRRCEALRGLPEEIGSLEDLEAMHVSGLGQPFSLPNSIGSLKSLLTLRLKRLRIDHIPASIGELERLKHLVISNCSKEKEMPESLGNLKSLVELDLSKWGGKLPASIGGLLQLKELDVSGCLGVEEVADSLQHLKSLVWLDLSHTDIINIKDSIGDLQELQVLRLSGCYAITRFPESIGRLKKLVVLVLSGSSITSLPSTIDQLALLEELDLRGCRQLQQLPELPPSLTTLRISTVSYLQNVRPSDAFVRSLKKLVLTLSNATTKLMFLSSLTRLESLKLTFEPLPSASSSLGQFSGDTGEVELPRLSNLKNLSSVRFRNLWMEDGGLADNLGVEELGSLETARVENCNGELIKAVCHAKSLRSLDVIGCREITQISGIEELQSLDSLMIYMCGSLERLGNLSKLKKLSYLDLSDCPALACIEGIEELQSLDSLMIYMCGSLERLGNLSKLKKLFYLDLSDCLALTCIEGIEELQSLDSLVIKRCGSLERLGNLSKLQKLSYLSLSDCPALTCIEGIEEGGFFLNYLAISGCDSLQNVDALLRRSKTGRHNWRWFRREEDVTIYS